MKKQPRCEICGGPNVTVDAQAKWDLVSQEWEVAYTYDDAFCEDCQSETHLDWRDTP